MKSLSESLSEDIRVDILENKNPHIIAASNETNKWIFEVEGEWYFFNPKNRNILHYRNSQLLEGKQSCELRLFWLNACLQDYISKSWFKKSVREKQTVLYRYGKEEIVNRGIRELVRSNKNMFKLFSFTEKEIQSVMIWNNGNLDKKTKKVLVGLTAETPP